MQYTKDTEPALSFHRWVALGTIASAMQRKCYMDWGMERIFPNLYIVLLGPSAQTRKTTALRIGEQFIKALNIPIIGQDNSPEAVIREVRESLGTFNEDTIVKMQSAATCYASEMAVFLGRQNTEFQAYLTDWYDSPEEWKRTTKHQGVDDITGMCFNLIGAMAPDWVPHIFMPESIGGGFTSRIVFVSETRKAKTVANPNKVLPPQELQDALELDLERIHRISGAYKLSPLAEKYYEDWYIREDRRLQAGDFPVADPAFQTYCGRRGTLLRKLSMAVAASRSDERVVEIEDITSALLHMEDVEARMPGTFASIGRNDLSHQMATIKRILEAKGEILRSDLMSMVHTDVSLSDLEEIERTLEVARIIKIHRLTEENDTRYKWIG